MGGPEFAPMRKQHKIHGLDPELPCGALAMLWPACWHDVIYNVTLHKLKRYNLIIAASDEYLVDELLQRLTSNQRPRENRQERQEVEIVATFITQRTFLCSIPTQSDAATVAQSTTEAQRSTASSSN